MEITWENYVFATQSSYDLEHNASRIVESDNIKFKKELHKKMKGEYLQVHREGTERWD